MRLGLWRLRGGGSWRLLFGLRGCFFEVVDRDGDGVNDVSRTGLCGRAGFED